MGRKVWVPVVSGPLAPYAAGFERWLRSRAYSSSAAADRLYQFDQLSRWLERGGLGAGGLTGEEAARFVAARRAKGLVTWASPHSVLLPLGYLRELGVAPAALPPALEGPLEVLLADYGRYLLVERGLCQHTVVDAYGPVARLFLAGWESPDGLGLGQLSAADVSRFLARECPKRSVTGARDLVCALRSLLRYLHLAGLIEAPLAWAVPSVADLRDRTLPRGLEPAAVSKLLASCDRRTLLGRRDYAILLLLARLGLRAGEVAAIQLADVDWRAGLLLVRGKGSRRECAAGARRRRRGDRVVSSPSPGLRVPGAVCAGDRAAPGAAPQLDRLGRARCVRPGGVAESRRASPAAHGRDRDAQAGRVASLAEIGQVLRHRAQKTTAIYAKVDRTALRALARPWPSPAGGA